MSADRHSVEVVLEPGTVIDGKYQVIGKLGQGEVGVVYKARALDLRRISAIKMLTHGDADTRVGFLGRAALLGNVTHRAVVRVDDFGDDPDGGPYLAMAYYPGWDLAAYARRGPVAPQEAVDLILAVCSGVCACHDHSIIHGALKPNNVRVTTMPTWQDRIKILDCGLVPPPCTAREPSAAHLAACAGYPERYRYLAPELLRPASPSKSGDQYGIASLFYLLLTGQAPYHDREGEALTRAIIRGDYPPLALVRPGLPQLIHSAVARGLHADPDQRFPSVGDFANAILPESSPELRNRWTDYFYRATHGIDHRLMEPVSACHSDSQPPAPFARIVAPLVDLSGAPGFPFAPPLAQPLEATQPVGKPPIGARVAFAWGIGLGLTLPTLVFLVYLIVHKAVAP